MSTDATASLPRLTPVPPAPRAGGEGWARLPAPLSALVGREAEIAAVSTLLADTTVRLVTLTGPGGVGKTRLALATASEFADRVAFPDGVAFVPLAPLADPSLVAATVAQALGVRQGGHRPAAEQVIALLDEARFLLVLDNFEHLLPAAPLVARFLSACPRLTVLATSRERLRLSGEHLVPVAPLSLPPASATLTAAVAIAAAAVRLFVRRAGEAAPAFAFTDAEAPVVAEICTRLDGLPLAIELAAARTDVLSPRALLARLDRRLPLLTDSPRDAPARHRTLRNAVAWSYDLLPPEEQVLFRRLAVFSGGFTLEAAEEVSRGAVDSSVLDGVSSLVAKSLVHPDVDTPGEAGPSPRFTMLETVREFGLEQLAAHDAAGEIEARHAAWCLALAETAKSRYYTAAEPLWFDRLEVEHANVRAALRWLADGGDAGTAQGLRLVAALAWFWHSRGPALEGADWCERFLARPANAAPIVRADALTGATLLAWTVGRFERAAGLLAEALSLWRDLGDRPGLVRALNFAVLVANARHDPAGEMAANTEAVALARAGDDPLWLALSLGSLGHTLARQGEADRAIAALEEDLALLRVVGYERGMGWALEGLASAAMESGAYERAQGFYREALSLAWKHRSLTTLAIELRKLAVAVAGGGQPERAARLLAAAVALRESLGASPAHEDAFGVADHAERLRATLGDERFVAAWSAGRAMPLDRVVDEALESPSRAAPPVSLTPREAEILPRLVAGQSDREIAEALFLSRRTVENHVARLTAKLGVRSRAAAVEAARAAGLLPPAE